MFGERFNQVMASIAFCFCVWSMIGDRWSVCNLFCSQSLFAQAQCNVVAFVQLPNLVLFFGWILFLPLFSWFRSEFRISFENRNNNRTIFALLWLLVQNIVVITMTCNHGPGLMLNAHRKSNLFVILFDVVSVCGFDLPTVERDIRTRRPRHIDRKRTRESIAGLAHVWICFVFAKLDIVLNHWWCILGI